MNKKILFFIFLGLISLLFGYQKILKKEEKLEFFEVKRGRIIQFISESGTLEKGEKINLSFKVGGTVKEIFPKVGDEVKKGDILMKLENKELQIQLREAQAGLEMAQSSFNKLLSGPTAQEIKIAREEANYWEKSFEIAKENLKQGYENVLVGLDSVYLNLYNSLDAVRLIERKSFVGQDSESLKFKKEREKIEVMVKESENLIREIKNNFLEEKLEETISEIKKKVYFVSDSLLEIREIVETSSYRGLLSAEISNLESQRISINSTLANLVKYQQSISSLKLNLQLTQVQAQIAKEKLAKVLSPPRKEDLDLYQAQIKQAEAKILFLENEIEKTILKSPVDGLIVDVKKRVGETAQPLVQDVVIAVLPKKNIQIKTDIYEEDITQISLGNKVEISIPAFKKRIFFGRVIFINPVEKIKEGVVYYEIKIEADDLPKEVLHGMSCDLKIITQEKENVIIVPKRAIKEKDGEAFVEVLEKANKIERKIEAGIKSEDEVEVISGLKEGEKVVLY